MPSFLASCLLLLAASHTAIAQSSASAYVQDGVPTDAPIPGDYTGALRPQMHYSPPKGFMVSLMRMCEGKLSDMLDRMTPMACSSMLMACIIFIINVGTTIKDDNKDKR